MADLQPLPRENQKQDLDLRMQQREERKQHDELTLEEQRRLAVEIQSQQLKLQSLQQRQRRPINKPSLPVDAPRQKKRQRLQREHRAQQLDFKMQRLIRGFSKTDR